MRLSAFVWMVAVWVTLRTVLQSYSQLQMAFLKAVGRHSIGPMQFAHAFLLLTGILLTYRQGWSSGFCWPGLQADSFLNWR